MKKCISFLLVATMLFSCVACKKEQVTEQTSESTTATTTEITTTTEEPTPTGTGVLAGLKEESGNFFINEDPKYKELVDLAKMKSEMYGLEGVILIATDDEIILFGGPKSAMTIENKPVDPYTIYDIASCSKAFTAVAVFQLIEEGKIALDDTLDKYFPDYEDGKRITIYNLLHMQSGIKDYFNDPEAFFANVNVEDMDAFLYRFFHDEVSDEELLQNLYVSELDFEPGTKQAYSNTNYDLLAQIVEQVSGEKFCDYLKKNVFDICGLEHTTSMVAGNETSVPKNFDMMLEWGMVDETGRFMAVCRERGSGGIHTCAYDLLSFDRALFGGKLVSDTSLSEMKDFVMGYGCGLISYGKKAVGHSGFNGAYITQNVIIDTEEFGKVYLIEMTANQESSYGLDSTLEAVINELTK
ncbi:MAG: beta-lactamase family protein [Clostridiales bacterium]|nr:beta-lactamase family protein [Clostridiales bacterium]